MCDARNPREPGQEPAEIQGSLSRKCHLCLPPGLQYILLKKKPGHAQRQPRVGELPPKSTIFQNFTKGGVLLLLSMCIYIHVRIINAALSLPQMSRSIHMDAYSATCIYVYNYYLQLEYHWPVVIQFKS